MKKPIFSLILILFVLTALAQQTVKIVVLHTNDTHSQIEPTAANAVRNPDMGGYARRAGVISHVRSDEKNVVLLDAGDFSQGTPFYNYFSGRVEMNGYNMMEYDAGTLGNHEFDNGIDSLAMLLKLADHPIVVSNYDASASIIAKYIKPYTILRRGKVLIGIMGLGVQPAGLIMERNYQGIVYRDPIETAKNISEFLKKKKRCNVVICLSHLGSDSTSVAVNDFHVAHQTEYIDVILGGHSHSMLENVKTLNAVGKPVVIAQMGRSGLFLGRIDLTLKQQ